MNALDEALTKKLNPPPLQESTLNGPLLLFGGLSLAPLIAGLVVEVPKLLTTLQPLIMPATLVIITAIFLLRHGHLTPLAPHIDPTT